MSTAKSPFNPPKSRVVDDELKMEPMSRRKRWVLIGIAIFCLLIFSVTTPMMMFFGDLFGGGPAVVATAQLPSGRIEIDQQDLEISSRLMGTEKRLLGRDRGRDQKDIIAYTVLLKLAEDMELVIPDGELQVFISSLLAGNPGIQYQDVVRTMGYPSAVMFENALRSTLRVPRLERILLESRIPTRDEVMKTWQDIYGEFQAEFLVWKAEDFVTASLALEPSEEELTEFYASGLDFTQRRELENEDGVAFDGLLLSADALGTAAVAIWADPEEPSEEALQGFYDFNKRFIYLRPEPEEGTEPDPDAGFYLTREELGERVAADFKLHRAALTLLDAASSAEDLAAFAAEKGVEPLLYEVPVPRSQISELERIGASSQLFELFRAEAGVFLDKVIMVDGAALLLRPTKQTPRELPPLEEIRDSVVDYWRESRQPDLAKEAAEAFLARLPQPEVEGDPIVVDQDAFAAAASADGLTAEVLGWVSRQRRASDPVWPGDDKVRPWLRGEIGRTLDDYSANEIVGPLEFTFGDPYVVVARLVDTRDADPAKIWPAELRGVRFQVQSRVREEFSLDGLAYEGLAQTYDIQLTRSDG